MSGFSHEQEQYFENLVSTVSDQSTTRIEKVVEDCTNKTIKDVLKSIGIDSEKAFEMQDDMSFLRKMRKMVESFMMKFVAAVIALVSVSAIVWAKFVKGD